VRWTWRRLTVVLCWTTSRPRLTSKLSLSTKLKNVLLIFVQQTNPQNNN
jgi:hypothetical protein